MATTITVIGNLVKDPEKKDLGSGKVLAKLRLASTERFQDSDGTWKDGDTASPTRFKSSR